MVSISPKERERESEREREREREKERKREKEIASNRCAETREHEEHFPSSVRDGAVEKKREDSTLEPSKSLGKSNLPKRERERESPRNVRPRPRTLTVLYVNRSSFRSFKMLPKPMLSRRPKHPLFARKAHESNWCPSKGAL